MSVHISLPLLIIIPHQNNSSIDIYAIKDQFMLGQALLVAPVLEHSEKFKSFYLPDDIFYDLSNGKKADVSFY